MAIIGRDQKHVTGFVGETVFVDTLLPRARNDINQFEKVMFMFKLRAFVQCFINNAEGFVQVFLYHKAKIPNYISFVPIILFVVV
jgi:hypothetical protein